MSVTTFIKALSKLDRSKSLTEKFRDFCEMAYCAYAKTTSLQNQADALEQRYMQIVKSYDDLGAIRAYPTLLATVYQEVQKEQDFLGLVAAEIGALDSKVGQIFTPYHVSKLMAAITLADVGEAIERDGYIRMNEPTVGSGGIILAAADMLTEMGHVPARHLFVHAQDIGQLCFHMCFIQLTFKGIPALVERCNTLSLESFEKALTPVTFSFCDYHYQHRGDNSHVTE